MNHQFINGRFGSFLRKSKESEDMAKKTLHTWEIDEIVQHMNEDHGDSLLLYARCYGGHSDAMEATLIDISEEACTLSIKALEGIKSVTVKLKRPVSDIREAERVMVEMHFDALQGKSFKPLVRDEDTND